MQINDEKKAERILASLDQILNLNKSSASSVFIIKEI
jgi:hypothetical protein